MNCPQCQTTNPQDSAFCSNCGMRLVPATASAPSGGYAPQPGQAASAGYAGPTGYGPGGQAPPASLYAPAGQYSPPRGQQPPAGYTPGGGARQQPSAGPVAPFQFDVNRLSRADRIVGVASLITMISIWLPWFSASVGGISATGSGTDVHGWLWLVFVLGLLVLGYLVMRAGWEESPVRLPLSHEPLLIAATGLQLLLVLIAFFDMPSFPGVSYGWAWGAFIGLLAAIVAAAPIIVPWVRSFLEARRASS